MKQVVTNILRILLIFIVYIINENKGYCSQAADIEPYESSYELSEDFLGIELGQNFPTSATKDKLRTNRRNFFLSYYHLLHRGWAVGVNGGYRSFAVTNSDTKFALFSLSNFVYHIVPLYHPLQLWFGGKWLYLLPVKEETFPFEDYDEYNAEIGVSASMMLTYIWSKNFISTIRADRWRGTNTDRLHGYEVSIGSAWAL